MRSEKKRNSRTVKSWAESEKRYSENIPHLSTEKVDNFSLRIKIIFWRWSGKSVASMETTPQACPSKTVVTIESWRVVRCCGLRFTVLSKVDDNACSRIENTIRLTRLVRRSPWIAVYSESSVTPFVRQWTSLSVVVYRHSESPLARREWWPLQSVKRRPGGKWKRKEG